MDKSQKIDASDDADFVLKHRVVGAGVLLLFGALVLPWLLGPPSQASKLPDNAEIGVNNLADFSSGENSTKAGAGSNGSNNIEDELLAAIEAEDIETEERVYISKITPLNNGRSATVSRQSSDSVATQPNPKKALEKKVASNTSNKTSVPNKKREKAVVKKLDQKIAQVTPSVNGTTTTRVPTQVPKTVPTQVPATVQTQVPATIQTQVPTTVQTQVPVPTVEFGWVVQVGVFTDKNGADKVVKDLQSKGFTPSITVVDTNRGKGTGTRVWLGPFAQRVDAAKTKTRLTEKTGEPGFIRAFP